MNRKETWDTVAGGLGGQGGAQGNFPLGGLSQLILFNQVSNTGAMKRLRSGVCSDFSKKGPKQSYSDRAKT